MFSSAYVRDRDGWPGRLRLVGRADDAFAESRGIAARRHPRQADRRFCFGDRNATSPGRGDRVGHGAARHRERSCAVGRAGRLAGRNEEAQRRQPERDPGFRQRVAGDDTGHFAARHPERRSFRHRTPRAVAERDRQPARRLPAANLAHRNRNTGQPGPQGRGTGDGQGTGDGRSHGRSEDQSHRDVPGAGSRRRGVFEDAAARFWSSRRNTRMSATAPASPTP